MKNNNDTLTEESIFRIGHVISVDGRKIKVAVHRDKNTSHIQYKGELVKNISVGSYIKILKGFSILVGKVDGEFINEEKPLYQNSYSNEKDKIKRILIVSLLGYFESEFKRGVKELPLIDNECFILNAEEFHKVHNFIRDNDFPLDIGELSFEKGLKVKLGTNALFASHIGIFGNTGSGKSYTLAKIYETLFDSFQSNNKFKENAKFFLFDFNGEYIGSSKNEDNVIVNNIYKNSFNLTTRRHSDKKFPISEDEINDLGFWSIYLSATEKTQTPFLGRALKNGYFFEKFDNEADFKSSLKIMLRRLITKKVEKTDILNFILDTKRCAPEILEQLDDVVDKYQKRLKWHANQNCYYVDTEQSVRKYDNEISFQRIVIDNMIDEQVIEFKEFSYFQKIRLQIVFQFYDEKGNYDSSSEFISPLLKRLKRIDDLDKVIEVNNDSQSNIFNVISLKNVNTEMKKVLPLLICKQLYDNQKTKNEKNKFLNIIIDEAHNILSHHSERESSTWKDYRLETFEEIIKEGRKFGVFLTVSSQRPSDISPTIISQLHNYFLHRLINNNDIFAIEKTISYLDKVSFESLPIIPTGSCIFAGLAAQVPVMVDIGKIKEGSEPVSQTIKLTDNWIDEVSFM